MDLETFCWRTVSTETAEADGMISVPWAALVDLIHL